MIDPTALFCTGVIIGAIIVGCAWISTKRSKKKNCGDENIIFHIHHEY